MQRCKLLGNAVIRSKYDQCWVLLGVESKSGLKVKQINVKAKGENVKATGKKLNHKQNKQEGV
jgi:hypothetical protein